MHIGNTTTVKKFFWVQIFLSTIIFCIILAPGIVISEYQPSLRIEDPLILFAVLFLLIKRKGGVNRIIFGKNSRPFAIPYLLLTLWILTITLIISIASVDTPSFFSTILSFSSTMKAFFIAIVIVNFSRNNITEKAIINSIIVCLIIEIFIMYAQANNLFDIHEWLSPLYRRDKRFNSAASRIGGTYGNPNVTAVAIAAMLSVLMAKFVMEKKYLNKIFLITIIVLIFYCVLALTGSRTGMVMCIIAMSMPYVILVFLKKHRKKAFFLIIGIIALQYSLPTVLLHTKWSKRYDNFINDGGIEQSLEDPSFISRVENWKSIIKSMRNDILSGKGSLSKENWIITDNGYVSVILYGGIIGLCFYLWFLVFPAVIMAKHLLKYNMVLSKNAITSLLSGLTCLSILIIANITVPVYANTRLNATFMIIIALALNSIQSAKSSISEGHRDWYCQHEK